MIKSTFVLFLISLLTFSVHSFVNPRKVGYLNKEPIDSSSQLSLAKNGFQYISKSFYSASSCSCVNYTCSCCAQVDFPKIKLNDTACVNLTYIADDIGFKLTFDIDNVVYYEETISIRNPPPLCFGIPYLQNGASLCLKFYSLDWGNNTLSGCVDLVGYFLDIKVGSIKLGCFHLGKRSRTFNSRFQHFNQVIIINKIGQNDNSTTKKNSTFSSFSFNFAKPDSNLNQAIISANRFASEIFKDSSFNKYFPSFKKFKSQVMDKEDKLRKEYESVQ